MHTEEKSKRYSKEKYKLYFIDLGISFLFLGLFQFFASEFVKNTAFNITGKFHLALTIYLMIFYAANYIILLPFHFYGSFRLEHRFELSNQTISAWFKDEIKKTALSAVLFLIMMNIFYYLLLVSPKTWWIWAAVLWFIFTVFFARIMPTFIIPIFYKYSELPNQELKNKILALAAKSGIKLLDIFQIDFSKKTKKANAAVVGIGKSRRVILADTLINDFSEGQVISVCAHEFGHHKLYHMPKHIVLGVVAAATGFFILNTVMSGITMYFNATGISDFLVFPSFIFVLSFLSLISMPLYAWYSRRLENEADLYAIKITGDPDAFISVMKNLALKNLSDMAPPKIIKYFFYDHPPIGERISMAENYKKQNAPQ